MTDKLLSCPFCGEEPRQSRVGVKHIVFCLSCSTQTPSFYEEEEAIAAWNRRAAGWIPVEERLPEKGECLVVSDGTVYPASVIFGEDFKHCTHWMPLPEPPESREGGAE